MNKKNCKTKDMLAHKLSYRKYMNDYDELSDSMFHYMNAYINNTTLDTELFRDEIENLLGIREHKDIIEFIIKEYK